MRFQAWCGRTPRRHRELTAVLSVASTSEVHFCADLFDLHTHDTPGGQLATLLTAIEAGADAIDAANAAMSGTTSQPSLSSLVAATDFTARETGLSLRAVNDLEPYWEAVRRLYAPFESGLPAPVDTNR